jgi:glycosyltransferase involved in cell wall biosynthesis
VLVSGVVIVRNEEAVIERCLASLDGVVDEVIVVHDGACADRTLEIAKAHGARVFTRPEYGHCEAHTVFAYEQARGEWLLNIDGDEFLSDELRAAVPQLVTRTDVDGYEFVWPIWNGERYITEEGPFKLGLMRRSRTRFLGMLHSRERIDGIVERSNLRLEHRPRYNNWTLRAVATKWRRWARVHARELTGPYEDLPKFNWDGPWGWPWWRAWLNRLAPVLLVPYLLASLLNFLRLYRRDLSPWQNLRMSTYHTIYAGLVQLYVIRELYSPAKRWAPARDPGAR